jgi:hypothetical protein
MRVVLSDLTLAKPDLAVDCPAPVRIIALNYESE